MDAMLAIVLKVFFNSGYFFLLATIGVMVLIYFASLAIGFVVKPLDDLSIDIVGPVGFWAVLWLATVPFVLHFGFSPHSLMAIGSTYLLGNITFETLYDKPRQVRLRSEEF